jgi:hypothetical protein
MIPPRCFWTAYRAFAVMIGGSSNVQKVVPSNRPRGAGDRILVAREAA